MKQQTCNQCGKKMDAIIELEKYNVPVCINPECPNYGLLQISEEKIEEYKNKLKK